VVMLSLMVIPLVIKNETIGLLFFEHKTPNYYSSKKADLALAIAYQSAIAIENARLYEQAQELAALEERQKLARELHDSVSQALYGIGLGANAAKTTLETEELTKERLVQPLDYILSLAKAGLAEMRALLFELRPESLDQEGLVSALAKQIEAFESRHQIQVEKDLSEEPNLSLDKKHALYRIAQEALNNIFKHAQANQVHVSLRKTDPEHIYLEIQDNGIGFDPSLNYSDHLGLRSMRERAEQMGAEFHIDSQAGKGTSVKIKVSTNE